MLIMMWNQLKIFFMHLWPDYLFISTWAWWAAGIGIGLTALLLGRLMGRKLGVTGGFEDACSVAARGQGGFNASPSHWKLWFILGIPFGGLLANAGHWSWTLLYGGLDMITLDSLLFKFFWLLVSGFLIGFGARWAGGCVSGNSIMGISLGNKMSLLATVAFLAAGILVVNILFKAF
jgi:uncharacterized protein